MTTNININFYDTNKLLLLSVKICHDNLTLAEKTEPVFMLYNKLLLHC